MATTLADFALQAPGWVEAIGTTTGSETATSPSGPVGDPGAHRCDRLADPSAPTVSILIPAWNCAASIDLCLDAIGMSSYTRSQPSRVEVIVCDDGSTDDTWTKITQRRTDYSLTAIRTPHRSQSAAVNTALARADGDIAIFLDADMVLGCGAIDLLITRIVKWPSAICAGFRSNIDEATVRSRPIWEVTHTEAFSGDNRVNFDMPTLLPNMMDSTGWLTALHGGRAILDSQGTLWPRHRFVYGCLFSVRRDLAIAAGGFPTDLNGWGYNDTLCAAAMEAAGGFILPVAAAWGHHIQHRPRQPGQWFQMRRNEMSYRHRMNQPVPPPLAITPHRGQTTVYLMPSLLGGDHAPTPVITTWRTDFAMGRWQACLSLDPPPQVRAQCLFATHQDSQSAADPATARTLWGALSSARLGDTHAAAQTLTQGGGEMSYAATASVPELCWLSEHFHRNGLDQAAEPYDLLLRVRATQESHP
jgi:GT2 family glycosyltransferase